MRPPALVPLLALVACSGGAGDGAPPAQVALDSTSSSAQFPTLPDSLVLTTPDGTQLFFSGARVGTDSLGRSCIERGLVLVRDGTRKIVPLLMTGAAPTLVSDTIIRARIWLNCRPGNTYEVNVRTAIPTRIR